ncbi:MAG: protein kinase domain-containing protein, partial [Planctomycetota bacterium]
MSDEKIEDVFKTPEIPFILSSATERPKSEYHFEPDEIIAGRYSVDREIGAGGMCTVYLVSDKTEEERKIALKHISGDSNRLRIETFRNEFRILAHLEHENLIRVFDFGVLPAGRGFYYTAEYIEGKDLRETAAGVTEDVLADYIMQVCRALEYVHCRGYIHYDVKPTNILITGGGGVKLADFGLSALADRALGRRIRGTPAYTSPEIITGTDVDFRTDLYSLGVTLYEITTGTPPFRTDDLHKLFQKHVSEQPVPPGKIRPRIPEYLERIILRLLAKNPADRFESANSVIAAIAASRGMEIELKPHSSAEGYLRVPPLVAREKELDALHGAIEGLADGKALHVVIEGPAGIGRSRLLREIHFEAQLRGLAAGVRLAGEPDLFEKLDERLKMHPEIEIPSSASGVDVESHRDISAPGILPDAPASILAIARQIPVVLCLDDMQDAGRDVRNIVLRLSQLLGTSMAPKLLLVTAWRYGDGEEQTGTTGTIRLQPAPLAPDEVGEVVRGMFGSTTPPELFVRHLHEATGGVPFSVVETIRMLVASGEIAIIEGKWRFRGSAEPFRIAPSLEEYYKSLTGKLDGVAHKLSYSLALMERPLGISRISLIHDEPPDRLAEALDALYRRGIISRTDGKVEIANRGIRNAIIGSRTRTTARRRHAAIAERFEKIRNRDMSNLELARHFLKAGDKEKAIKYGLAGIRKGEVPHAQPFAIPLLERLRIAARNGPHAKLRRILFALVEARDRDAEPKEALSAIEEYRKIAVRSEPRERRARMESFAAEYHRLLNETDAADEAWRNALELEVPGSDAYLETLTAYVTSLEYRGRFAECEKILSDAARDFENRKSYGMIRIHVSLSRLSVRRGNVPAMKKYLEYAQAIADELGIKTDPSLIGMHGVLHMMANEYDDAIKHLLHSREIAVSKNDLRHLASMNTNLVHSFLRLGKVDEALKYGTEAEGIFLRYADFRSLAQLYSVLGREVHAILGAKTANSYLEKALEYARAGGIKMLEFSILKGMGDIACFSGDFESAIKYSEQSYNLAERVLQISTASSALTLATAHALGG